MKKQWIIGLVASAIVSMCSIAGSAASEVPANAGQYKGHYYYVYPNGTCSNYEEAVAYCEKMGGHLAIISSEEEDKYIYDYMRKQNYGMAFFGYRSTASGWKWVDETNADYTNWAPREPEGQKYARYKNNGGGVWCDDYWGNWSNSSFICEWDCKLVMSDTKLELEKGESTYLSCVLQDPAGNSTETNAKWKSSKTTVAKVSSQGKVVAVGTGNCKITCTVKGIKKTVTVIVKPEKVKTIKTMSKSKTFVQLKWKAQKGVKKYEIYIYDKDLEEYTRLKSIKGTLNSVRITGLKKNTIYRFKIRAYVSVNGKRYYGAYSNVYRVKTNK